MKIKFNKHIYISIAVLLVIALAVVMIIVGKPHKNETAGGDLPKQPEQSGQGENEGDKDEPDTDKNEPENTDPAVPEVLPEVKDRDISAFADMKMIMLTFDDGPNGATTRRLVDELALRNARATFFMVGSRISRFEDTVKYVYESGNTVGIHGYSHTRFSEMYVYDVMDEVDKTNRLICAITGEVPYYLRPPYGVSTQEVRDNLCMAFILWDLDSEDWRSRNADTVCEKIVSEAKDGSVVLLHDLYETSVDGVIAAVDILSEQGYCFVTIDEYLQLKGLTADIHEEYRHFTENTVDTVGD